MKSGLGVSNNRKLPVWLAKVLIAVAITITIQLVFIYIKYGDIFVTLQFTSGLEFIFTFLYFLSLFWIYPKISRFIHSGVLNNIRSIFLNIIEGLAVIIATFLLTALTKILPLWILLIFLNANYEDISIQFDISALRQSLIVHAILGLFFYYFVERERIRKQMQAEQLRYAQLQRAEFKAQLEYLKNQVNPNFLFTSLQALDELITKDAGEAVIFVNRLSSVYRSFLHREVELVSLSEEIALVEAYIYILKVRFKDQIQFDINIATECSSLCILPGTLQVLIENAVSYNKFSDKKPLQVKVSAENERLIIKNNLQQLNQEKTSKAGLENIVGRYRHITDKAVEITETAKYFIISLPLLRMEKFDNVEG